MNTTPLYPVRRTGLRDQLDLVLRGAGQQTGVVADQLLRNLWQQGEDFVDKPLRAAGLGAVEMQLGALDVRLLAAMRTFALDRLADVTAEAAGKIGQQLGLVTLGAVSPFEAISTKSACGYGLSGAPVGALAGKAGGVGAVSTTLRAPACTMQLMRAFRRSLKQRRNRPMIKTEILRHLTAWQDAMHLSRRSRQRRDKREPWPERDEP